jgi:hypothetical protein
LAINPRIGAPRHSRASDMNPGPAGAATRREPAKQSKWVAEGHVFCPNCGSATAVVHSAPGKHARVRRRECEGCGVRFTTTEKIAPLSMKAPIRALSVKVPASTSDILAKRAVADGVTG